MKRPKYPVRLCAIPFDGIDYRSVLSSHPTIDEALRWGRISGLSAWTGESATRAGYGPEGRLCRMWIEADGHPATLPNKYEVTK